MFSWIKWFLVRRRSLQQTEREQWRTSDHRLLRKHSAHHVCWTHNYSWKWTQFVLFLVFFFSLFQRRSPMSVFPIHVQKSPQCWRHTLAPRLPSAKLQMSPLENGRSGSGLADRSAGGSPLVGPLFGGVVRSDDLRLRHHSVLVLREGVAIWKKVEAVKTMNICDRCNKKNV